MAKINDRKTTTMKRTIATTLLILCAWLPLTLRAQETADPAVFEVAGKPVLKSELMKDFLQSIGKDPSAAPTACTYEKRKALEDYIQLYINFRAKLADAYALGYDTMPMLVGELKTYRDELSLPYLIDSATLQGLLHEAYERNKYVLHAAHILVPCPELAEGEDTVAPYQHAMELYNRAVAGEDFYTIAQDEMRYQRQTSPDPNIRQRANEVRPNEGDLGCFTVFDMIYPFETAVYNMRPGEVSKPIRTRYGYHIAKLFDRYEYYGKANIAHIWISDRDPNARGKINDAYRQLTEGADFATVVKNYSNDRNSNYASGGEIGEMPCNQLPPEYIATIAEGMKPGDYSQPFQTHYGWHIIKLVSQETQPPFESMVPYYKSRMVSGERSKRPQRMFAEQCKERYHFIDYTQLKTSKKKNAPYAATLQTVRDLISDSIFSAIFHYDSNAITDMRPLFSIDGKEYNSRQFARYIYKNKKVRPICSLDVFIRERYREFVEAKLIEYADSRLEQDNDEFRALVDEYRHGLMIFAYNDKFIWSRAINDSAGFADFYAQQMPLHDINDTAQAIYFWNERARVTRYIVADSACMSPDKALKIITKGIKKAWSSENIKAAMLKKVNGKKCQQENPVTTDLVLFEKDNQRQLSPNEWSKGMYVHPEGKGYVVLVVEQMLPPEPKALMEARGYYLNDYQNHLEKVVSQELRKKYGVVVHQDVIDEIAY